MKRRAAYHKGRKPRCILPPMGALQIVERPSPRHYPVVVQRLLNEMSRGARWTYDAHLHLGNNDHGAVWAKRETIASKRRELGAPAAGNSLGRISAHRRELEDAGLIVRLERTTGASECKRGGLLLVFLLGWCPRIGGMVGLSGKVCIRLGWDVPGIQGAIKEGTLSETPWIHGPLIDPTNRSKGRRRLQLDQFLPPLRRGKTRDGAKYDSRLTRHAKVYGPLQTACLHAIRLARTERPLQVYRFPHNLKKEEPSAQDSGPGGPGCVPLGREEGSPGDAAPRQPRRSSGSRRRA